MKKFILIKTSEGGMVWTTDESIAKEMNGHLLNAAEAAVVFPLFDGLDMDECVFSDTVSLLIWEYTNNKHAGNDIYLKLLSIEIACSVTRPNAIVTGCDDLSLLY